MKLMMFFQIEKNEDNMIAHYERSRTVVENACGRDFAEAMIGHKFYLSTYYNLSEAQKKELYLKAEPYLTISNYAMTFGRLIKLSDLIIYQHE